MSPQDRYDRLVDAAGNLVIKAELSDCDVAVADRFLAENRATLAHARQNLKFECWNRLEYEPDFFQKSHEKVYKLRDLARGFEVEASDLWRQGSSRQSIDVVLAIFDLANVMRREGLVVHMLAATAFEGLGVECLRRERRKLGVDDALLLSNGILRREQERESVDAIIERDARWTAIVEPKDAGDKKEPVWPTADELDMTQEMLETFKQAIEEYSARPEDEQLDDQRMIDRRSQAWLRLLAIEAAIIAYGKQHGVWPNSLERLAPEFIPSVPLDPLTKQAFHYTIVGDDYRLYSPGPCGLEATKGLGPWIPPRDEIVEWDLDVWDRQATFCPFFPRQTWRERLYWRAKMALRRFGGAFRRGFHVLAPRQRSA